MRSSRGQAINIDYTVALGVFLLSVLSGVLFVANAHLESSGLEAARQQTSMVQQELRQETLLKGRQVPLYVRTPAATGKVPVDREYIFPDRAEPGSGVMDVPAEINVSRDRVVTVVSGVNSTHQLSYFYSNTSDINHPNQIETGDWMNNSKISVNPGGAGLRSLRVSGEEVLNSDADLNGDDFTVTEHELHASALSGDLKIYNGSGELILEDPGEVTFDLENFDTLYWHPDQTYSLDGTGTFRSGETQGFTVASGYGVTFTGRELKATVSKPDSSTVRATVEASRLRVYLHDTGYGEGRDRIQLAANGTLSFGTERKLEGASGDSIERLESLSEQELRERLEVGSYDYNITFGSDVEAENFLYSTSSRHAWSRGSFSGASADRPGAIGELGLGYQNGTGETTGLERGLVGYWRLDRDVPGGGGTALDYSGRSNDGTFTNGVNTAADGILGTGSAEFDHSSNEYVSHPDLSSEFSDEATISLWLKRSSQNTPGADHATGLFHYGTGTRSHYPWTDGSIYLTTFADRRVVSGVDNTGFDKSEWHHLVITTEPGPGNYEVYQNGELFVERNGPSTVTLPGNQRFGYSDSTYYFNGKMDEVRLYNRSLSRREIRHLYFQGRDGEFNGSWTGRGIVNDRPREWRQVQVKATIPEGTTLQAVFQSITATGGVLEEQSFAVEDGVHNYSLDVPDSENARLVFRGRTDDILRSWNVESYRVFYRSLTPMLEAGDPIPLEDVIVSDRPSVMLGRFGNYTMIQDKVILWR